MSGDIFAHQNKEVLEIWHSGCGLICVWEARGSVPRDIKATTTTTTTSTPLPPQHSRGKMTAVALSARKLCDHSAMWLQRAKAKASKQLTMSGSALCMRESINPQFKNVETKKSHYKSRSSQLVVRDLRDPGKVSYSVKLSQKVSLCLGKISSPSSWRIVLKLEHEISLSLLLTVPARSHSDLANECVFCI